MNLRYCKKQLENIGNEKQINNIKQFIHQADIPMIIKRADQLKNHTFVFDKTWDMEPCTTPYHFDVMDWNAQRNDDEEWCFMLNRMDYLSYLMLAGVIERTNGYFEAGKQMMLDWIAKHKEIVSEASTRTLDTGIRIANMMDAIVYLYAYHKVSDKELQCIIDSIYAQIQYMKASYLSKYTLSNWGSIQTCAVVSCMPIFVEGYKQDAYFIWALEELTTQLAVQVYADGMHWEQSTMYHVDVLQYVMKVLLSQRMYKFSIDKIIEEQAYKLCDTLFYQATPTFEIEAFGDSDRVCIRDIFVKGASLFSQSVWKYGAYSTYDYESLYVFGAGQAKAYEKIPTQTPKQLVYDGEDSGMFTVRSSWNETANFTMFTNGSLGSGHGHSDNLHISVYRKGYPILIDSGRFTYREDHPLRTALKGMKAHNSVILDEHECSLPSDSWGYRDFGLPLKTYVRHEKGMHYVEGSYIGHDPLHVWTRKVMIIDCGIWIFVDSCMEDGFHTMRCHFHIDPALHASPIQKGFTLTTTNINMQFCAEGIPTIRKEPCSLRYNTLCDHSVLTFRKEFENETTHISYLCDQSIRVEEVAILQNGDTPISKDLAQAYKFCLADEESYTTVFFHKEIFKGKKLCYCEGMPLHAKGVVIHEVCGHKKVVRMRT